ncbi:SmdB family multidrug efflux ABC transporter permease/ATP-binding protein [Buchnera aphidicola]
MKIKKMLNLIKISPTLHRLLSYAYPWKKSIFIALIMLTGASISETICPLLISYFIDDIIAKHKFIPKIFILLLFSFIILQIISIILHYFQNLILSKIAIEILKKVRIDVMKSAILQPLSKFDKQPIGQIIAKVTNDTELIKDLYDTVIISVLRSFILIFTILIAMFTVKWEMAVITIIVFPLIIIVMIIYQHYSIPILRKVRSYLANINNSFNEAIKGMKILQQFRQEDRFGKKIQKHSKFHYKFRMQTLRLDGFLLRPLLSLFSGLVLCGWIILFSFYPKGTFEIGILYVFINYLSRLNEPLITITTQQSILQQAIVSGERIFQLIDSPKQKYGKDNNSISEGKINIKNLNFSYHIKDEKILKNINLKFRSKEFIALVGRTGSGKSTLANLLMGYYQINDGNIYIDGRKINDLSQKCLRKGISMVQQEPYILADSLFYNITLGRNISENTVWKILEIVQMKKFTESMKYGIHSILGEEGNNLSIGQKQLLSIARVLVSYPKILILDEATANIDSETEIAIQKTLKKIKKKTTLIIIAHRLSTVTEADSIIVLNKGEIVEQGSHEELMKKKSNYWNMYKLKNKI